jgi:hypothetical protein
MIVANTGGRAAPTDVPVGEILRKSHESVQSTVPAMKSDHATTEAFRTDPPLTSTNINTTTVIGRRNRTEITRYLNLATSRLTRRPAFDRSEPFEPLTSVILDANFLIVRTSAAPLIAFPLKNRVAVYIQKA